MDLQTEQLIFLAQLKAISEQSTYLTAHYKQKMKQDFNIAIKHIDGLIKSIEANNPSAVDFVQGVTDVYHNINLEIRNNRKS